MKKTITSLLSTFIFMLYTISAFTQSASSADEYLVQLPTSTVGSPALVQDLLNDHNSSQIWFDDNLRIGLWRVMSFPYTTSDGTVITNINESVIHSQDKTEIDGADLNYKGTVPSVFSQQSNCNQSDYHIYLPQGSQSVKIAILDTGISDISDNSQSGFNFSLQSYSGYDYVNEDFDPEDDHGHGSHIAGIIADIINYSSEQNVSLDIKKTHNSQGEGYISTTIRAVIDCVNEGVDVINMSFSYTASGNQESSPLKTVIDYAESQGVLVISSAGNNAINNDNFQEASFPATYSNENIISVASINCYEELSYFSNYGATTVDLAIIGEGIMGPDLYQGIVEKSGTSQAVAIISGLSAVLGTHLSEFSPEDIKCLFISSSEYATELEGIVQANGFVNGSKAYESLFLGTCVDIEDPVAYSRNVEANPDVSMFPNPAHNQIFVGIIEAGNNQTDIAIRDIQGKLIKRITTGLRKNLAIDISMLSEGLYYLEILTNDTREHLPFVKLD